MSDHAADPESGHPAPAWHQRLPWRRRAAATSSVSSSSSLSAETKLKKENAPVEKKPPPVPFIKLFRFTTPAEKAMMAFSSICAVIHGALLPLWTIVFGDVISSFSDDTVNEDELVRKIGGIAKVCLHFTICCFCALRLFVPNLLLIEL